MFFLEDSIDTDHKEYNDSAEDAYEAELDGEDSQTSSDMVKGREGDESVYPMKTIKVEKGFYTAFELKRKYDKEPSVVILDSDFQRKSVWNLQQKRELIESVLMGLPLPIFYFNEDKKGRLIVVDGRQRLTALFEFMDKDKKYGKTGGFSLDKLVILDDFNKKKFEDLDPVWQSKIEDYQIAAHVIQPPTPDRIKFDIFDRVNRAGTQLNKQEIRNALYQGNATRLLNELCALSNFDEATEHTFRKDKRMKDRYLLLRFIAFYLYFNKRIYKDQELYQYASDIDELLGLTMEYLNNVPVNELKELAGITDRALRQICFYLGNNAFRLVDVDADGKLKRYPININIFEILMYAMTLLPYQQKDLAEKVKSKIDIMKKDKEFRESINNHRDSLLKVTYRYELIQKIIGEII